MGFTHNFLLACLVFLGTYPAWAKDRRDPTSEASTTPITIRVYVPPDISQWTVAASEQEASQLLRKVHVRWQWLNCTKFNACVDAPGPSDLVIRILPFAFPNAVAGTLGVRSILQVPVASPSFFTTASWHFARKHEYRSR